MIAAILTVAILGGWLLSARLGYRITTRWGWFDQIKPAQRGLGYSNCPDYRKNSHPSRDTCRKCEPRGEAFADGTRARALNAVISGPGLLAVILVFACVTARQPLSPMGQERALKRAQADLAEANAKLAELQN
jgi:hypothetical protein